MEQEQKMENCSNCGILLAENKIDLHEAYCIRNCIKCDLCGQFFSKDVMETHIEEDHQNGNQINDQQNIQKIEHQQNQVQLNNKQNEQQEESKVNIQQQQQQNQFQR
ncbi:TRAF-like protein [Pseudocohnilembus persalinus]|uniref:TRAF-like protein n=1 Tax=Pseudocohnilembus persalinus TaxID=266149 RepID=A0A0V0QPA8_PSEPJ|nr:TRAF-like protein [Pseudocohnilembus persalinus]|eukprot:KRX03972.1 TRAF-like protein [Pseudocohnilembus persalinus]